MRSSRKLHLRTSGSWALDRIEIHHRHLLSVRALAGSPAFANQSRSGTRVTSSAEWTQSSKLKRCLVPPFDNSRWFSFVTVTGPLAVAAPRLPFSKPSWLTGSSGWIAKASPSRLVWRGLLQARTSSPSEPVSAGSSVALGEPSSFCLRGPSLALLWLYSLRLFTSPGVITASSR